MKTYSRGDWQAAQDAWADGEFSSEWRDLRHTMAMQGVIFPPAGDRWDSWEDDSPSQRAVLIRAIRETPALLSRCVKGASSWQQVIERLFRERDEWRAELRRQYVDERPTNRRPMTHVGPIARHLLDSLGFDSPEDAR